MIYALVVLAYMGTELETDVSSVVAFYDSRHECREAIRYFSHFRFPNDYYHCLRVRSYE